MVKVFGKKGQLLMVCGSVAKAYEGLQKGSYKIGGYDVVEESGKVHRFVKYICERKSR